MGAHGCGRSRSIRCTDRDGHSATEREASNMFWDHSRRADEVVRDAQSDTDDLVRARRRGLLFLVVVLLVPLAAGLGDERFVRSRTDGRLPRLLGPSRRRLGLGALGSGSHRSLRRLFAAGLAPQTRRVAATRRSARRGSGCRPCSRKLRLCGPHGQHRARTRSGC